LLDNLTHKQIQEWEAYDRIDPIGTWRDDFRMAKLASLIENIAYNVYFRKPGEDPKWVTPEDEMPNWSGDKKKEEPGQTVEQMKLAMFTIAKGQNKKVARENIRKNTPPKKK
jgi:hypothetical protein